MNHYLITSPKFCSSQDSEHFFNKMGNACHEYRECKEGLVAFIYDHKLERLFKLCAEYEVSFEKIDLNKAMNFLKTYGSSKLVAEMPAFDIAGTITPPLEMPVVLE